MSDEVKLLPCQTAKFCCVRKMGDYVLMAVTPKGDETLRYWLSLGGAEVLAAEITGALSTRPPIGTDEVVERVAREQFDWQHDGALTWESRPAPERNARINQARHWCDLPTIRAAIAAMKDAASD